MTKPRSNPRRRRVPRMRSRPEAKPDSKLRKRFIHGVPRAVSGASTSAPANFFSSPMIRVGRSGTPAAR